MNTTSGEVGDLKLDVDGPLGFAHLAGSAHAASKAAGHTAAMLVVALDRRQTQLGPHQELFAAAELLDLPHNCGLFGRIVHRADVGAEAGGVCVLRDGDQDLDVVGGAAALELGFGLFGITAISSANDKDRRRRKSGLTLSIYSIRDPECDSTTHSTQINGFTCVFSR